MLDHEDLRWIASTTTNLNSTLQQIARYTDLARRHKGQHTYLDLLGERVELAAKTAQSIFDKVTSRILAQAAAKAAAPGPPQAMFTVVPPPASTVPVRASATAAAMATAQTKQPAVASLDFAQPSRTADTVIPNDIKIRNPRGHREYILIVEDNFEVADLAADMLAEEGYKLILARDGFEALQIYQKIGKQIGLVILDFFLPVMDGDAVFDELRMINPDIDVVLSSGFAEQDKISAMLTQGLRGFIPKPYTKEKLLEQVRETLDSARQGSR